MPTSTYIPLATTTLASSASSVTFSSISGSYRDLVLVIDGEVTNAGNARIEFNADTGSNYSIVYAYAGTSTGSFTTTQARILDWNTFGMAVIQILDYSAINKHKTFLSRNSARTYEAGMVAGRWANTAAITSVKVYQPSGGFEAGSTFSLFGIEA